VWPFFSCAALLYNLACVTNESILSHSYHREYRSTNTTVVLQPPIAVADGDVVTSVVTCGKNVSIGGQLKLERIHTFEGI